MTAHSLNSLIFSLAAKLECIGIHTCGSICDIAGENRTHIKSFDWYASKWSFGDIVEVNFNKDKKSFHAAKIINSNFERTKFIVCQIDCDNSKEIEIDQNFIRSPMPLKLEWNVNELCEFKNPRDSQWYLGKIINFNPIESTLSVELTGTAEGWKVFSYHISKFLRPVYDNQILLTNYKTINPITGEDWFFISDPTHVFKKLRNNLSRSHIGEKNSREIMINGKEISWRHIKGVYDHTCLHATAKATRLTKCHIWLSFWSKIRVDFAEHTLSKEVEDALLSIKELKNISEGTRDYIKYSRKYRQIMHSKINFQSLEDPRSMIQPKRISQDMLEGLFGTIRELGGDSSTQTLKSYGYDLNKYQITTLVSTEIKSVNYGVADSTGTGITTLARRDYRKDKKKSNNEDNYNYQKHFIRLTQLSSLSHNVFKSLLIDDLIMGKIKIPLESRNENVDQENYKIFTIKMNEKTL
ncbi:hypothetical protein RhiirA5_385891 [Rhizophagus irregularis]|uniref:Transposable element P transposase-like GTP-binding insertion domain-containing protein n=1 Tax=Rhizophagus irregularis TaxID=588596 RepID=A0A2N0NM04_9GLOM|nr:hypothetical protein RhiirA5_385891 [Rhizophagus irregularis]